MNKGKNLTFQELEDIQMNTNFVVGHKMVGRVRKNRAQASVHHRATILEIQPVKQMKAIDFQQKKQAHADLMSCKQFMHPEPIQTGNYDSAIRQVKKVRRLQSAGNAQQNRKTSMPGNQVYSDKETEFLQSIRDNSKRIRSKMVNDYMNQIKGTLSNNFQTNHSRTVTHEKMVTSLTETNGIPKKVIVNKRVSNQLTNESEFTTQQLEQSASYFKSPKQPKPQDLKTEPVTFSGTFTTRPNTGIPKRSKILLQNLATNVVDDAQVKQNLLQHSEKAKLDVIGVSPPSASFKLVIEAHTKDLIKITNLQEYDIFIPSQQNSRDEKLMMNFVKAVREANVLRAAACLTRISSTMPGYNFNLGLLRILEGNFIQAIQIYKQLGKQGRRNLNLALKMFQEKREVIPSGQVNMNYFTRQYAFNSKNQQDFSSIKPKIETKVVHSDWDLFLFGVRRYKANELQKFIEDKIFFDQVLKRVERICNETEDLIPNMQTKILQDPNVQLKRENIVKTTVAKLENQMAAINENQNKKMEFQFKEMINQYSTYCVGGQDPVLLSLDVLVEGIRVFSERFGIEKFARGYMAASQTLKVPVIQDFVAKYKCTEPSMQRARTFIASCISLEATPEQNEDAIVQLLNLVSQAEEARLKGFMDPNRFQIEQVFNHIIEDVIMASRVQKGAVPLDEDDQYLVDRLKFHKEITSRPLEDIIPKISVDEDKTSQVNQKEALKDFYENPKYLEWSLKSERAPDNYLKTKTKYKELVEIGKYVERPSRLDLIEAGKCPIEFKNEIKAKIQQLYDDNKKKDITPEAHAEVLLEVKQEIAQIDAYVKAKIEKREQEQNQTITTQQKIASKNAFKKKMMQGMLRFLQKKSKEQPKEDCSNQSSQSSDSSVQNEPKFLFNPQRMQVGGMPVESGTRQTDVWAEGSCYQLLRQCLAKIQEMCLNEQVIFDRDAVTQAPMLERWGIHPDMLQQAALDLTATAQNVIPKIGQMIPQVKLDYLLETFPKYSELFESQLKLLDEMIHSSFRFFNVVDEHVRTTLYKSLRIVSFPKKGQVIETDAEESHFVYIMIKGTVNYKIWKHDTKATMVVASYREGDVFGDASIQRQYFDVMKILCKDEKYLQTATDDVYAFRVPKQDFVNALFEEMQQELIYKILLFRKTPLFQDLSPYSLIMFANICQVREYRYGDIILNQGERPDACYIIAYGRCKSVYKYPEVKSKTISNNARRILRQQSLPQPFRSGKIDYKQKPYQDRRENQEPSSTDVQKKKLKNKNAVAQQEKTESTPRGHTVARVKRACYLAQLNKSDSDDKLVFENHILCEEIKQGEVIGSRVLLDNQTFKKHISQNSILFTKQVGVNVEELIETYKMKKMQTMEGDAGRVAQRSEALAQMNKFCNSCFEQRKPKCDCKLKNLELGDQQKVLEQVKDANIFFNEEESPLMTKEDQEKILIAKLHDNLLRSQTSIVVTTHTAKLIIVRKEDKSFLNEALKQAVDKVILDTNFKDHDRPMANFEEIQSHVAKERGWIEYKEQFQDDLLRKAKLGRQENPFINSD